MYRTDPTSVYPTIDSEHAHVLCLLVAGRTGILAADQIKDWYQTPRQKASVLSTFACGSGSEAQDSDWMLPQNDLFNFLATQHHAAKNEWLVAFGSSVFHFHDREWFISKHACNITQGHCFFTKAAARLTAISCCKRVVTMNQKEIRYGWNEQFTFYEIQTHQMATARSKQGLIGRLMFVGSKKLAFQEVILARSSLAFAGNVIPIWWRGTAEVKCDLMILNVSKNRYPEGSRDWIPLK